MQCDTEYGGKKKSNNRFSENEHKIRSKIKTENNRSSVKLNLYFTFYLAYLLFYLCLNFSLLFYFCFAMEYAEIVNI